MIGKFLWHSKKREKKKSSYTDLDYGNKIIRQAPLIQHILSAKHGAEQMKQPTPTWRTSPSSGHSSCKTSPHTAMAWPLCWEGQGTRAGGNLNLGFRASVTSSLKWGGSYARPLASREEARQVPCNPPLIPADMRAPLKRRLTQTSLGRTNAVRGTTKSWVPALCQGLVKDLQALSG